jgi:O-antigen/teichoic acid export membrane protein
MLVDAGTLVGTMALTAGLGFVYWLMAARYYPPEAVGLASAAISAMILLGEIGVFGLSTLLIGQLSRHPSRPETLISTAFIVTIFTSGSLGALFALISPLLSPDLAPIGSTPSRVLLYAVGVVFMSTGLILDYSTIGLQRGGLQLARNVTFSVAKLGLLWAAALWVRQQTGIVIYITWIASALFSVVLSLGYAILTLKLKLEHLRPDWSLFGEFKKLALGHQALNLANQAPGMFLPVLVTILLSVNVTASFYIAWMITSFILYAPTALSITLYAASSKQPDTETSRMRLSILLSLGAGVVATVIILFLARFLLSIFGATYVQQAELVLKILAFTVFPHTIVVHYVAKARIHDKVARPAIVVGGGALVQLILASVGSQIGGAPGFSLGWLVGLCITATITAPAVIKATFIKTAFNTIDYSLLD